jgi:licheninase
MKRPSPETHILRRLSLTLFVLSFILLAVKPNPSVADERASLGPRVEIETPVKMIINKKPLQTAPPPKLHITGRVVDSRNNPVKGAQVRAPGRPVVITDRNGEFKIRSLARTERLAVSFSAPGFMDTTRIYKVGESSRITGNVVVIWPRAAPSSLDAARGGRLSFPDGAVSFPPNSLVDMRGRPLRGSVTVSFSTLDVSDRRQVRSAPGDFTARMRDKRIRQLETYGIFEVYVEDSRGRRANLAPGRKAAVELFIPRARRPTAPKVVGLFSFDTNSGLWIEAGTLQATGQQASYETPITSIITIWNADEALETTCLKLQVLYDNNQPAPPGTKVEAEGVDYSGSSPVAYTTGTSGEVCLSVKRCATVRVTAFDPANPAINSCPLNITSPCHVANAGDCANASLCPLQPQQIYIPIVSSGDLYHDLNAHNPANWHAADGWTNFDSVNNPAYDVWWLDDNVLFFGDGLMRLHLNNTPAPPNSSVHYNSGEYRTNATYGYGAYEACLKAASGPGLMTSFFTYTGPFETPSTQHDEIDIEFRGLDTNFMWTNFFFNHSAAGHEAAIPLGFDAAYGFHRYKFVWTQNTIEWFADGVSKRTVNHSASDPLPLFPSKIMMNLWSGQDTENSWFGDFTYQGPVQAEYDWIKYSP